MCGWGVRERGVWYVVWCVVWWLAGLLGGWLLNHLSQKGKSFSYGGCELCYICSNGVEVLPVVFVHLPGVCI